MALGLLFVVYVTVICVNDVYSFRKTQLGRNVEKHYAVTEIGKVTIEVTWDEMQSGGRVYRWSPWGSVSDCSRTCGTGVQYKKRYCYKTSKQVTSVTSRQLCSGRDRKYQLCSRRPCPGDVDDFRDRQCRKYNRKKVRGKYYKWSAHSLDETTVSPFKQCQLVCTTTDRPRPLTAKLSNKATDGTPCMKSEVQGVCIRGKCKTIGCNKKLGSTAVLDRCGVCGGDNKTCKVYSDVVNKTLNKGYNNLLTIPTRATDISMVIGENGSSVLALRTRREYYPITDRTGVSYPQSSKHIAGTILHHNPQNQGKERIWSKGSTNDTLYVIIMVKQLNSNIVISYSYTIPKHHQQKKSSTNQALHLPNNHSNSLADDVTTKSDDITKNVDKKNILRNPKINRNGSIDLIAKSQTERYIVLQERKNHKPKERQLEENNNYDINHQSSVKPRLPQVTQQTGRLTNHNQVVTSDSINNHVTTKVDDVTDVVGPYTWKTDYSACSQTCSPTGVSFVFAKCYDSSNNVVKNDLCDPRKKPQASSRDCGKTACEPRWVATRWSHCTSSCGEGYQYRNIRCWQILSPGLDSSVHNDQCSHLDKPITVRKCTNIKCGEKPKWVKSEWTQCSVPCGHGSQSRAVTCDAGPNRCNISDKPRTVRECHINCQDVVQWVVSQWTLCTSDCTLQHRSVNCRSRNGSYVDDSNCDANERPLGTQLCSKKNCPLAWVPQEWGECSVACGEGTIFRQLICGLVDQGEFIQKPDSDCRHLYQPHSAASCRGTNCPGTYKGKWYAGHWSKCSVTCGEGTRTRHVSCYHDNKISRNCDPDSRPYNRESCTQQGCGSRQKKKQACRDDPRVPSCELVVQHKLCSHYYYKRACCLSCSAGNTA